MNINFLKFGRLQTIDVLQDGWNKICANLLIDLDTIKSYKKDRSYTSLVTKNGNKYCIDVPIEHFHEIYSEWETMNKII